jgi:hypothetical protein
MSEQLPPVQEIWRQIQPYSQRLSIAFAVFAIITVWFFNCMSPSIGWIQGKVGGALTDSIEYC